MSQLAAASADDLDGALVAVLARWRELRTPELADLLDVLSARVARPPIAGKTVKARHQAWIACARLCDPADTPRLVAILLEGNSSKTFEEKLEILVARGPDPRAAAALVEIIWARTSFVTIQWMWSRMFDAIDKLGDPRGIEKLRWTIPSHEPARGYRYMGEREVFSLERYIWECLPPVVKRLEQITMAPLDDADRAALERLRTPSRAARTEAELLDAVLANPADDAPRLVLADALQARGDARGELIALQLGRARDGKVSAREKSLLKALVTEVVGPLAPVALDPVIERGFLAGARAVFTDAHDALIAHPWWRTAEALCTTELRLLRRRDLPALRRIRPLNAALQLLDGEPLPGIEALELGVPHARRGARSFGESRALPGLRELALQGDEPSAPHELAPILDGPLGARLERLVFQLARLSPADVVAWHVARPRIAVRFELPAATAVLAGDTLELDLRSKVAAERHRDLLEATGLRVELKGKTKKP